MRERELTNFIKVERVVPRDGAVKARLEEGGPAVPKLMWTALVVFAHPRHTGEHGLPHKHSSSISHNIFYKHTNSTYLAAIDVFHSGFSEEEKYKFFIGKRADEIGSCKKIYKNKYKNILLSNFRFKNLLKVTQVNVI